MPTVSGVVEAVRKRYEAEHPVANDQDFLAEQLVGTFVLLRRLVELESARHEDLAPQDVQRIEHLVESYMHAEFVIGNGMLNRDGELTRMCKRAIGKNLAPGMVRYDTFENCYNDYFGRAIWNISHSYNHRRDLFPIIFCARAQYYLDLIAEGKVPLISSPSVTHALPTAIAKPKGQPCSESAGDDNGNGLCDVWERSLEDFPPADLCKCKPTTPKLTWEEFEAETGGLYGPFDASSNAAVSAWPVVYRATFEVKLEHGFWILRDRRCKQGCYYITPPVVGLKAEVTPDHYENSYLRAFSGSCEDRHNFVKVGTGHSHPRYGNRFSCGDFMHAIELEQTRPAIQSEGIFLFTPNRCIQRFRPDPTKGFKACENKWAVAIGSEWVRDVFTPIYRSYELQVESRCFN